MLYKRYTKNKYFVLSTEDQEDNGFDTPQLNLGGEDELLVIIRQLANPLQTISSQFNIYDVDGIRVHRH